MVNMAKKRSEREAPIVVYSDDEFLDITSDEEQAVGASISAGASALAVGESPSPSTSASRRSYANR